MCEGAGISPHHIGGEVTEGHPEEHPQMGLEGRRGEGLVRIPPARDSSTATEYLPFTEF